jgi:MFS superfamily sulfate permease-like transporter
MPDPGSSSSDRLADGVANAVAGISIAGLLLPEAVAYASIANLPPQAGVIALFAGLLAYGLAGASRFAVVSATSSSAAVLAAVTASVADGSTRAAMAVGLVLLTGAMFVVASMLRLGNASDFIAKPVLRGFTFGLALVIAIKQLPKVLGVHPDAADMLHFVPELLAGAGRWNLAGLALGAAALLLLFGLERWRRVPGALVVIAFGVALGSQVDLKAHGIDLVGAFTLQLVAPAVPELSRGRWLDLAEVAFATMFVLYAESYGAIRTLAMRHGDEVAPNRDLLALGLANIASGLFHGMPVGAGYSASSANEAAGAQGKLSTWVCAGVVLAIVLTLLPAIARTPEPVLAAIVIHAVGRSLDLTMLRPYFAWRRDRLVVLAAVLGVPLLGVLNGLLTAIGFSLMMTLKRLAESSVSELGRLGSGHDFVNLKLHAEAARVPSLVILRPETPVFFANVEHMLATAARLADDLGPHGTLIISLEESPDLDGTSVEALRDFASRNRQAGRRLLLARLKAPVREVLLRAAIDGLPASALTELSVDDAVQLALAGSD